MSKRLGGKPSDRNISNDIFFDYEPARFMINFIFNRLDVDLTFNNWTFISNKYEYKILDACCGNGVLGNCIIDLLKLKSKNIDFVDIKIQESLTTKLFSNFYIADILEWKPSFKYNIIICNPPWSPVDRAEEIYHHLLSLLDEKGILVFIINYAFINTNWKRGEKLGNGITLFLPRYTFNNALKAYKPESCGLLDPVVMINRQSKLDMPFFIPINPIICKTEQLIIGDKNDIL